MQRKGFYMSRRFPIGLLLLKKLKVALLLLMPHFFILLLGGKEHEINLGHILIENRHKRGITQDELASYMGVSKAAVSKWETGV